MCYSFKVYFLVDWVYKVIWGPIKHFLSDTSVHIVFEFWKDKTATLQINILANKHGNDFGYKDYRHIEFAGPVREEGVDPQLIKIKEAMKRSYNHPLWQELGKICIDGGNIKWKLKRKMILILIL